jgi:hypothetical protein
MGSTSSDPDGDTLQYSWNVGENPILTEADPAHTYNTEGVFDAVLTVDDQQAQVNSVDSAPAVRIVVGNDAPAVAIDLPAPGSTYVAGSDISFSASTADAEDGSLPASGFSWTVSFHHAGIERPVLGPVTGISSGQFSVPTVGEDATDVFFRIRARVTDSGAPLGSSGQLSSSTFVDVVPIVSTVTVRANPPGLGLQLQLDQVPGAAPLQKESVAGFPHDIGAPSPQSVAGRTFEFASWSDGGTQSHVIATPSSDTTYTAQFACIANCGGLDADLDGFTTMDGDCDDANANVYPGAPEICDLEDNDCDGNQDDWLCDDFDTTGDGVVDGLELAWLGRSFGLCSGTPQLEWWFEIDLSADGCVDGDDLAILASVFACSAGQPACGGS